MKQLYVLAGHWIPNPVQAVAVFQGVPTKQQLFDCEIFDQDKELDNFLIDRLLISGVSGQIDKEKDRFEYLLLPVKQNGSLDLNDLLYTGVLDMPYHQENLICIIS